MIQGLSHLTFIVRDLDRMCAAVCEVLSGRPAHDSGAENSRYCASGSLRLRVDGEGRSVYFYDHDNHLFELHTGTLDERLAFYVK